MSAKPGGPPGGLAASAYVAFAAFGAFWGVWGASVPRVRDQAGVSDGQLGLALLFVGAGALPAMLLAGRALDRFGLRVAAGVIALLGVVGTALALTARSLPDLCVGLAVAGAASGAADVAMNAVAGRAEQLAGRPVIARAHGTFSALVVVSGLATGFGAARAQPLAVPFAVVALIALAAGAAMLRTLPPHTPAPPEGDAAGGPGGGAAGGSEGDAFGGSGGGAAGGSEGADGDASGGSGGARGAGVRRSPLRPLLLIGVLGAIAFANENAQQSWSAVYARDQLHSGTGLAAVAPAVFAATVSVTRFGLGGLKRVPARTVVLAGALIAAAGSLTIASAPNLPVAACGLVLSGAGTAVLFPTLIGVVSRNVAESRRGRATSIVGTVSYLGFLLGPVYIGTWAGAAGLRGAMVADAALACVLFLLTAPLLRLTGFTLTGGEPATGTARADSPAEVAS
ncbi:MFS transporter [Streptomyces sp. SL13]|uniref:MFS transporter n=1 Tax=Streptantibioticus silvisoli TaxID=2705255 RepID=A0AA90GW27_9ACTN|nr:MFS transporter [Streptantibioticus silvisoli]MDI5969153.1 MFS transporter [Streptantibioticus silvisoli]